MINFEAQDSKVKPKEINLRDYWVIFLKRKWLILSFAFVVFAAATVRSYTAKPIYAAKGTLLIQREPNILSFEQIFQVESFQDDYYQTQYKILQSRSLADRAIEKLKLYENEEFVGKPEKMKRPMNKSDPVFRGKLVTSFLRRLEVKPIRLTRLVEVNFRAGNPKLAADGVNGLFDSFIEMNIEAKSATTEQATEFLTGQIASLRSEIERKEKDLQAYGAEKNIIALSDKETTVIDKLTEFNRALTQAQIDRSNREANYNEIKNATPDYVPDALANPLIQRLKEEYVRMSREYTKMAETFRPEYPEMQKLKSELESAKRLLENETQNLVKGAYSDYQSALKKEQSLQEIFNRQKQEAIQLNSNAISYNSLRIEIENRKSLLESLSKRQSETGVSARLQGMRTSNILVVDRAEVPLSPSSPKKKRNMILALMIGLMGGIGLAFLFEYLDNSVKSADDVEKNASLPTLGIVPTFNAEGFKKGSGYGYGYGYGDKKKTKKKNKEDKTDSTGIGEGIMAAGSALKGSAATGAKGEKEEPLQVIKSIDLIAHFSPKSSFSESYRSIRTALLLSSTDSKMKALVVTSPLPAEGKTATVSNLAVTLAQANKKVLLVDADLRKPRLHRIFGVKNLAGLTNYLTSDVDIKELIKATDVQNLYFINSGPVPPNPAELLGSDKMAHFIDSLEQTFDYVLFDTPSLLAVTDAMVMGPKIGIILIVWGGKTSREALKRAREKLDLMKIKALGVIINRLSPREHDYYYKHYYYHYYGES